jgi:glycosyltransferase involved in cell wall biosynthesis
MPVRNTSILINGDHSDVNVCGTLQVQRSDGERMKKSDAVDPKRSQTSRICMVTSTFPRWADDSIPYFVLELATDLVEQGWQVDVLAPHCTGAADQEDMEGVSVTRFRYMWPDSLETLAYGAGGAIHALRRKPWNALLLPFFLLAQTFALRGLVKRRQIDLINSHWLLPQGLAAAAVARFAGVPHVATVHGGDVLGLKNRIFTAVKRAVLQRCVAVTANSSVTESAVHALAHEELRIERIPLGAAPMPLPEPEATRDVREHYAPDGEILLLFVGRLIPQKGCSDLLAAMALINQSRPDIRLIIAGDGPDRKTLERLSVDLGIARKVEFAGWTSREALVRLYHAASLFVASPVRGPGGEVEAFGLVFVEAALAGLPTVATNSGGVVDIVVDGETGLLVDEHDPDQFARAVLQLIDDPEKTLQMGAEAKRRAGARFTRQRAAAAFAGLFREMID